MKHTNIQTSCRGAPAFTLVELMMVITIIILLAAIMLPALDASRTAARNTAIKSLLVTITAGLETFSGEFNGQYPWSIWDTNPGPGSPTPPPGGDPYDTGTSYTAYGAQTLVWALAGADLLGTPGFQVDSTSTPPISLDRDPPGGVEGLYELSGVTPVKKRLGPYINISKTKIKTPAADADDLTIPEVQNRGGYGGAPVIVDDFNRPVLYFAADRTLPQPDVYRFTDNNGFRDTAGNDSLTFWTAGQWSPNPTTPGTGFRGYIEDRRVGRITPGLAGPYNRDSFLLITAGRDLHYGTGDDIDSFPFNALPPP